MSDGVENPVTLRYETHFGGVRYLFVRGMRQDEAMSGVYQDRPELDRVEALAALFGVNDPKNRS